MAKEFGYKPYIVCLVGSTRFWRLFQEVSLQETLKGHIVLSIGAATGTDEKHFSGYSAFDLAHLKARLDVLHYAKIAQAHEVICLNPGDYIGESTMREIYFARSLGIPVTFYEESLHYRQFNKEIETGEELREIKNRFRPIFDEVYGNAIGVEEITKNG